MTTLALAAVAWPGPAPAQFRADGSYPGLIACDPLPFATRNVRETVTLTVAGGEASFSRRLSGADGPGTAGATESARGRIGGGQAVLVGGAKGKGFAFESRYSGTVDGRGGLLVGTQTWIWRGATHRRTCQVSVGSGRG